MAVPTARTAEEAEKAAGDFHSALSKRRFIGNMHRNHTASKVKASLAAASVADNRTRPMLVFYMDTEAMDMGVTGAGLRLAAE
jgi:hypothetical protein